MLADMKRRILHVDMDEFFAAVEKLDNPDLRGKCLLVGGSPTGRGVVSTASYEARKFGCGSAMPMARALRLCPHAIVLPVRGRRYRQVSEDVFAVFERFTPAVEPLSIDEAFLDVTGCERLLGPAEQIASDLKRAIREEIGLTASVGVAPNKFLAKLASDLQKPDGTVVITEKNMQSVLDGLLISRMWGVGPAAEKQFASLGVRTIGQLRRTPLETLTHTFGSAGAEHFHRLSRGLDDRPVTSDGQAKSIGQEITFAQDVDDLDELRRVLLQQAEQVSRRLRRHELKARTVTVKLRYGDFTTLTRSTTLREAANTTEGIWQTAEGLLAAWAKCDFQPLRLLGVTATQFVDARGGQLPLFPPPAVARQQELDRAVDRIAERFGPDAVRRAGGRHRGSK